MSADLRTRIAGAGLDWIVPEWPAPATVRALVTTRRGPAGDSFDVGSADPLDDVARESRRRLRAYVPAEPHWLRQVHGTDVLRIDEHTDADAPTADAAVTATPGVVCAVRVADCLPVLLSDVEGGTVGVAHAGWRGLAAGVIEAAIRAVRDLGAGRLVAWLGPAIGPAAFEVGPEVREAFCARDAAAQACFRSGAPGRWHADLYGLAALRLRGCGITSIAGGGYCTMTDAERFFSFRRDGTTGRMAALIWIEPCRALV